jgi:hypothetical protein
VQADIHKFEDELGGVIPRPKVTRDPVEVAQGVPITVIPECNLLTFDPVSLTKRWTGEMVRFGFDFRPTEAKIDEVLSIRISIQIGAVEIAHLNCLSEVVEGAAEVPPIPAAMPVNNPLAEAKAKYQSQGVQPYQRIFISYSRQDTEIVDAFRFAQLALGNEVFMDTYSIPPGVDWRAYLAKAIDEAEIFQLFWSENSASSENVRHEWEYALEQKCPDTQCVSFIRPMYWSKPLPKVPDPLSLI